MKTYAAVSPDPFAAAAWFFLAGDVLTGHQYLAAGVRELAGDAGVVTVVQPFCPLRVPRHPSA